MFRKKCSANQESIFVKSGLKYWRSAISKIKSHDGFISHKLSIESFNHFLIVMKEPTKAIDKRLNQLVTDQIKQNRKMIIPIISCVDFIGKNNLPLRGHRDGSQYYDDGNPSKYTYVKILMINNQVSFRI